MARRTEYEIRGIYAAEDEESDVLWIGDTLRDARREFAKNSQGEYAAVILEKVIYTGSDEEGIEDMDYVRLGVIGVVPDHWTA